MCGIAGIIGKTDQKSYNISKRMIDKIGYRGPDEIGVEVFDFCTLAHARLAVVDKENGGQPMSNTDGSVCVVFNGEIFNFVELRESLKAKGYHFKSKCDTEVLVHLWRDKGVAMLDDLIGMFAFCLWDETNQKGILARDRQGIKPCYFWKDDTGMVFASEIKALFEHPRVEKHLNVEGLGLVHSMNYCPPPQTCFKNIYHLPPGHYISFDTTGKFDTKQYWDWPLLESKTTIPFDDFEALLEDAIRLQMRFDVEGCLFLSGGVDSTIIAHKLVQQWNRDQLIAYGLDCQIPGFGEFDLSKAVANKLNIDLRPVKFGPQDVQQRIAEIVWHADQPHGDFSFLLISLLCDQAHKDGIIVAFNGDGPDEALGGFGHNESFFSSQVRPNFPLQTYFKNLEYMPIELASNVLRPSLFESHKKAIEVFESKLTKWRELEPTEQIAAYELTSLMPGNNLIKGDRMGAAKSVEGRSPFLDHRISELFAKLNPSDKLSSGVGKRYLKEFGLKFENEDHLFRKKTMPTLPIGEWMKSHLFGWASEQLQSLPSDLYDVDQCITLLDDHRSGKYNHTRSLRTLITASIWLNQNFQT